MSNKTKCDRCGKEMTRTTVSMFGGSVVDVATRQELVKFGVTQKSYELCRDCFNKLEKFLKGAPTDGIGK